MTDKEKIIAEIERLKEIGCPLQKGSDYQHGYDEFYTQIKTFINSLPAEPSEDLEKEIKLYQLRNPFINHQEKSLNDLIKRIAIYFAQWQKEQVIEKACGWLQKHMNDYLVYGRDIDFMYDDFRKAMED